MKYGNWGTLQRDEGLLVPSWVSSRPLNSPSGAPPLWNMCYISRCCRCSPVHRRCQLVNAHSLVELAAGIIKLQTGFRPGVLLWGETARSSACQQLIRATLTTASPSTRYPNSISTHYQANWSWCFGPSITSCYYESKCIVFLHLLLAQSFLPHHLIGSKFLSEHDYLKATWWRWDRRGDFQRPHRGM